MTGVWCGLLFVVTAPAVFVVWSAPFMTPAQTVEAVETGVFEVGQYRPKTALPPAGRLVPATRAMPPYARLEQPGEIEWKRWDHEDKCFLVNTDVPNRLVVEFFAFPGWEAEVNGSEARWGVEAGSGLVELSLPPGRHDIHFVFRDTAVRAVSRWVSLLACFVLSLRIVWRKARRSRG